MQAVATLVAQWRQLGEKIEELGQKLAVAAKADPTLLRLMSVPGVGPMIATAFAAKVDDAKRFRSARQCVAWLGLTPREHSGEHSSGEKRKLKSISKAGDEDVRSLLVLGAVTVLIRAKRAPQKADPWVVQILQRKPFKVAAVALAARLARTLWALLKSGATYGAHQSQSQDGDTENSNEAANNLLMVAA